MASEYYEIKDKHCIIKTCQTRTTVLIFILHMELREGSKFWSLNNLSILEHNICKRSPHFILLPYVCMCVYSYMYCKQQQLGITKVCQSCLIYLFCSTQFIQNLMIFCHTLCHQVDCYTVLPNFNHIIFHCLWYDYMCACINICTYVQYEHMRACMYVYEHVYMHNYEYCVLVLVILQCQW